MGPGAPEEHPVLSLLGDSAFPRLQSQALGDAVSPTPWGLLRDSAGRCSIPREECLSGPCWVCLTHAQREEETPALSWTLSRERWPLLRQPGQGQVWRADFPLQIPALCLSQSSPRPVHETSYAKLNCSRTSTRWR